MPTVRIPSRVAVRAMRTAISPRLAISSERTCLGSGISGPAATVPRDERDTRTRPPTRVAGSRPSATQRCTVRTVTPSSSATWRGGSASSVMSRLSQSRRRPLLPPGRGPLLPACRAPPRPPGRWPLLEECREALLALRRDALAGGAADGGCARLVGSNAPLFADERLRGARGARAGRSGLGPQRLHPRLERSLVGQHLVDQAALDP